MTIPQGAITFHLWHMIRGYWQLHEKYGTVFVCVYLCKSCQCLSEDRFCQYSTTPFNKFKRVAFNDLRYF
jgi:hypothetical protein